MTKHQPVSPDFVSRQEAATRLMLSLRQVDRLLSQGVLVRTKVSSNRTGIPRVSFEAYLAARGVSNAALRPEAVPHQPTQATRTPESTALSPAVAAMPRPVTGGHFSLEQQTSIIGLLSEIFSRR